MAQINKKLKYFSGFAIKLISYIFMGLVLFCTTSYAMTLIYDEETETYLHSLIRPIYQAAGIPFNRNKIFIVQDNSLNAFVGDGNNLFIHTETILKAQTDDELRGIIAHEAGHIQGGHILRHKLRLQEMQNVSLASMVIAGAAGVASGRGDVAAAIALGSHSSLINQALTYQIQEERSADQAAVKLLQQTHHSPQGLLSFLKKIQQQNKLQGIAENSYFHTHPMSSERISFLQNAVKQSPYPPQKFGSVQLKRVQAKLFAFIKSPQQTSQRYLLSDSSLNSQYARAIAAFKNLHFKLAKKMVDTLITEEPQNPHFRELKGQILYELGQMNEAEKEFLQALQLLPNSSLFKINEAQTALELSPSSQEVQKIISRLNQSLAEKPSSLGWYLLARAYHLNHQEAESLYASAYYNLSIGNILLAKKQAETAKKQSIDPHLTLKIDDLLHLLKEIMHS